MFRRPSSFSAGGLPATRSRTALRALSTALTLAMTCAVAPHAIADSLGQVYVFGDSSADLGTQGPARRPTNLGPMWSEALGAALQRPVLPAIDLTGTAIRFTGGNSYAINGSTTVRYSGVPTFADQLDLFESGGAGGFDASDLVFTWFTRNDITSAFADGLPYDPVDYADRYLDGITRLRALGARNIVAFGAEIGLLADALVIDSGVPVELLDQLRAATQLTEAELWPRLAAAGVFILDIDRLGNAILSDPQRFGFLATTESYQGRGGPSQPEQSYPNDGNVFTAGGHFTSAMQEVIAGYALVQLRARDNYGQALSSLAAQHAQAQSALTDLLSRPTPNGWSFHAAATHSRSSTNPEGGVGQTLEGTRPKLELGLVHHGEDWTFGAGLHSARSRLEKERSYLAERRDLGLTLAAAWQMSEALELRAALGYTEARFDDIQRQAMLGPAMESTVGKTDASVISAKLDIEHQAALGNSWTLRSRLGLDAYRLTSDAYTESPGVLAMGYGDVNWSWAQANLGVDLQYGAPDARWRPLVGAELHTDLANDVKTIAAGPGETFLADYEFSRGRGLGWTVDAGFDVRLAKQTSLRFVLSTGEWRLGADAPLMRDTSASLVARVDL
jgi:phospholipase/lecithinase/hemolysin/uncharacterized protein YhjY with autotransporter beta-barrel domain